MLLEAAAEASRDAEPEGRHHTSRRISGGWHGFGAYRGAYFDTTTEGEQLTEHIAVVGIRYLFGAESLKANDRRGATLDQPSLPMRATNWVEPLD